MEFLLQFLPIIIYILLIIIIIVGIILGIKLILTIDKINQVVDDINTKVEKITPLFNIMGVVSDKLTDIIGTVVGAVENLVFKLFIKNKDEKVESDENE